MTKETYPNGTDCTWLALDHNGRIGAFVTAGAGPIPDQVLNGDVPIGEIEERAFGLPRIGNCRLLVTVPRPDDFIDMAERGFFVYDWTDIHRTEQNRSNAYELVAVPATPIVDASLPLDLANMVEGVRFADVEFADRSTLDVTRYFECAWPDTNS